MGWEWEGRAGGYARADTARRGNCSSQASFICVYAHPPHASAREHIPAVALCAHVHTCSPFDLTVGIGRALIRLSRPPRPTHPTPVKKTIQCTHSHAVR
jgi:hypothetical protein